MRIERILIGTFVAVPRRNEHAHITQKSISRFNTSKLDVLLCVVFGQRKFHIMTKFPEDRHVGSPPTTPVERKENPVNGFN